MRWALVALGGMVGALLRYAVYRSVEQWMGPGPWATMVVNVLGSFLLGAFLALALERMAWPPEARLFVAIGVLGSFTTFSTFAYETVSLLAQGSLWVGLLNLVGQVTLGLAGAYLGLALARVL